MPLVASTSAHRRAGWLSVQGEPNGPTVSQPLMDSTPSSPPLSDPASLSVRRPSVPGMLPEVVVYNVVSLGG